MGFLTDDDHTPTTSSSDANLVREAHRRAKERRATQEAGRVVNKQPSLPSVAGDMLTGAANMGALALNSATLGAGKQMSGLNSGILAAASGGDFAQGRREGMARTEGLLDAARSEAGIIGATAAEMAGAIPRRSGPGIISELATGRFAKPVVTGTKRNAVWNAMKDLSQGGVAGAAEGTAVELMNNIAVGKDFYDAAKDVGTDGILAGYGSGVVAQGVIGRALPIALKYGLKPLKAMSNEKVGETLLDTGVATTELGNANPTTVRNAYPRMRDEGIGLIETGAGARKPAEITQRLAAGVAKSNFGKGSIQAGRTFNDNAENYLETMGYIQQVIDKTQGRIKSNFENILGPARETTADRGRNLTRQVREYSSRYKQLTTPDSVVGGQQLPFNETIDSIGQTMAENLGRGKAGVTGLDKSQAEVFNVIDNELRPLVQNAHVKTLKTGADINSEPDGLDYSTLKIPLSSLMAARKAVADKFKPGNPKADGRVSKDQAAAGAAALKALDSEIALRTDGMNDEARAGYAKWMQAKDAEDTGAMFFNRKLSEDPEYGESMQAYMDMYRPKAAVPATDTTAAIPARAGNPEALQAFKDGFKREMMKSIQDTDAPLAVLNDLVGELPDAAGFKDINKVRSTGIQNLEAIIGKEETQKLLQEFTDDTESLASQAMLRGFLEAKQYDVKSIDQITRDMDELIVGAGLAPGNAAILTTSTMGALGRIVQDFGPGEAEKFVEIAGSKGDAAVNALEDVMQTVETSSRWDAGRLGGALTDNNTADESTIAEYLNSLAGQ